MPFHSTAASHAVHCLCLQSEWSCSPSLFSLAPLCHTAQTSHAAGPQSRRTSDFVHRVLSPRQQQQPQWWGTLQQQHQQCDMGADLAEKWSNCHNSNKLQEKVTTSYVAFIKEQKRYATQSTTITNRKLVSFIIYVSTTFKAWVSVDNCASAEYNILQKT